MSVSYEEFADLMLSTEVGSQSGLSRDEFIAVFKDKFPNPDDFSQYVASVREMLEQQVSQAQASLKPGESLGVAIPADGSYSQKPPIVH